MVFWFPIATKTLLREWLIEPQKAQWIADAAKERVEKRFNVEAMRALLLQPFITAYNLPRFKKRRLTKADAVMETA